MNNEIYQVRHHASQIISHYHIFTFREQNLEQQVAQQLQNAQAVLQKNHTLRRQFFEQLSNTFSRPMHQVDTAIAEVVATAPTLLPH
ncbi:hypothetical protein, partial [Rosenbergiella collisarenosi]|uniref:hypothetical protein n=1 Tax=Rosenbergiella collisarenosi TaxID=1544695 RepID=UPI001F4F1DF0